MNAKFESLAGLVATLALGVAYVGVTSVVSLVPTRTAAAADEKSKNSVSKDLAKTLKAAQDAVQAKPPKYQDALAKLKEADSNPKKTPYDEHVINELSAYAYAHTNQVPEAAKANEALINDGFSEQSEVPQRIKAVAVANYQLKN